MMKRKFLSLSIALLGLAATVPAAHAKSIPGYGGKGWGWTDGQCFSDPSLNGSATNICRTNVSWDQPLPTDQGWFAPRLVVTAPTGTVVQCWGFGVSDDLLSISGNFYSSNSVGGTQVLNSSSVLVPNDGHLLVACNVPPGARIHNVNW